VALHSIKLRGLDLGLTLYPSFVLSLFEEEGGILRKLAGRSAGCHMRQVGGEVLTSCPVEEAEYYTGVWYLEIRERETPSRSLSWLVEPLLDAYAPLSLSVDVFDPLHVFTAVFLSQATSYHVNVLSWTRRLWSMTGDPLRAAELAPSIGGSFQLGRLAEAICCAAAALQSGDARRGLLGCRYVGPKTADATLLFALADATAAPVDRHMVGMCRRLGLFEGAGAPRLGYCRRYRCGECPAREGCLRWLVSSRLGRLAGWVQTAFYVHEKLYCSRRRCGECPLRRECLEAR
jgi:hypothetical protein